MMTEERDKSRTFMASLYGPCWPCDYKTRRTICIVVLSSFLRTWYSGKMRMLVWIFFKDGIDINLNPNLQCLVVSSFVNTYDCLKLCVGIQVYRDWCADS